MHQASQFAEFLLHGCLAVSVAMMVCAFNDWRDDGFALFEKERR